MAEAMEKVSKKSVNKCKEDLGIPYGAGGGEKKEKKEKKPKNKDEDDPMANDGNNSDESKSASGSEEEEQNDEVPFEQKVQFTEKVRRLTNEGLTKLVKQVKSLCPDALEDVDDEKLHIQVDKLDPKSFSALDALVEENLIKKPKGGSKETEEPARKR